MENVAHCLANKMKRVVPSTIAAEALSLQEGLECGFYYRKIIEDILGISNKTIPIIAFVDNKSVIEAVYSTKLVDNKHLRVDIAAISESLLRNEVSEIRWCPGKIHLADCMTKHGASGYNVLNVFKEGQMPEDFILKRKTDQNYNINILQAFNFSIFESYLYDFNLY